MITMYRSTQTQSSGDIEKFLSDHYIVNKLLLQYFVLALLFSYILTELYTKK